MTIIGDDVQYDATDIANLAALDGSTASDIEEQIEALTTTAKAKRRRRLLRWALAYYLANGNPAGGPGGN